MSETLTHEQKVQWMAVWAAKHGLKLELQGECGFGRECVGVSSGRNYPSYEWYDEEYNRADGNGDVWRPEDAYHKHPCVAVLGRGERAEAQLYDWLKWFDDNGFCVECGGQPVDPKLGIIAALLGQDEYCRMVRSAAARS